MTPHVLWDQPTTVSMDRAGLLTPPGTDQPRSPWTGHDSSRPLGPTNHGLHGPGRTPHVLWGRPTTVSMEQAGLLTSSGTDQPRSPWTGQDSSRPLGSTNRGLHGPGRTASRPLGPTNHGLHGTGRTPHVLWGRPTAVSMDQAGLPHVLWGRPTTVSMEQAGLLTSSGTDQPRSPWTRQDCLTSPGTDQPRSPWNRQDSSRPLGPTNHGLHGPGRTPHVLWDRPTTVSMDQAGLPHVPSGRPTTVSMDRAGLLTPPGTDQPRSPWTGQDSSRPLGPTNHGLHGPGRTASRPLGPTNHGLHGPGRTASRPLGPTNHGLHGPGRTPHAPWDRPTTVSMDQAGLLRPLGPTNHGLHGPGRTPHVLWDRPTTVSMDQAGLLTSSGTDQPRSPWTGQDSSRPLGPTNHGLHGPGRTPHVLWDRPTTVSMDRAGLPHVLWDRPTTVSMDRAGLLTPPGTDQPRSPWTGQDSSRPLGPTNRGLHGPGRTPHVLWDRPTTVSMDRAGLLTPPGTDQPRSPWTGQDSSRPLGPTNRGLHGPGRTPHAPWDRPTAVSMDRAGLLTPPGTDQPRSPWTRQDSSRPLGPTNRGLHGPGRTASRPLGPTSPW